MVSGDSDDYCKAILTAPGQPLVDVEISLARNAHKHNISVHYWTIDDEDDMRHLIEIGADGIMTNYPHRLKKVYDSYKAQ